VIKTRVLSKDQLEKELADAPAEARAKLESMPHEGGAIVIDGYGDDAGELSHVIRHTPDGDFIDDTNQRINYSVLLTAEQVRKVILEGHFIARYSDDHSVDEREPKKQEVTRDFLLDELEQTIQIAMNDGLMFDCGAWPDTMPKDFVSRAIKLMFDGALAHPFEQYMVLVRSDGCTFLTGVEATEHPRDCKIWVMRADKIPDNWPGYEPGKNISFELVTTGFFRVDDERPDVEHDNRVIHTQAYPEMLYDFNPDEHQNTLGYYYAQLACFLMMLNTRNLETRLITVAEKLNKARRKRGAKPLPPYRRVLNEDYVTALTQSKGERVSASMGGTHASPVGHKRRSHIRHLPKGDVMVREAYVNIEKGKPLPPFGRSHYEMRTRQ